MNRPSVKVIHDYTETAGEKRHTFIAKTSFAHIYLMMEQVVYDHQG